MKLLGIGMIGYGFLKGRLYRNSDSKTGRRLGAFIGIAYIVIGLGILILNL